MSARTLLQARWRATSPREQRLLLAALVLVLGAAVWWLALAAALATLRSAETQHRALDAQWQQMQALQMQAKAIQVQPPLAAGEARRLLEASVKALGPSAQMSVLGERATVTFKGASADALAQWLVQARLNARALPGEAHWVRTGPGTWDGTLVLNLP
jgi:general secretion pathway protein M